MQVIALPCQFKFDHPSEWGLGMRMNKTMLFTLMTLFAGASLPAPAAVLQFDQVHSLIQAFRPTNELAMTILENNSQDKVIFKIIDRFSAVGHALIVDAENGRLIQDLASIGDQFELPAKTKIGIYFIPTAKVVAMTFRIQVGSSGAYDFNLKKQYGVGIFTDARWDIRNTSAKVQFKKEFFEKGDKGVCWTCVD
jgi:hypothetical protein